ncbi:MAG: hypothetical protein AB7F25_07060 [Deferribacterales bacterium]
MSKSKAVSGDTILLDIQYCVCDVSASLKFIIKSLEEEEGRLGQVSCLLNVLQRNLHKAESELIEYTFEKNIVYPVDCREVSA